jgi:hypothetical protein
MNELERIYERLLLNEYTSGFIKQQVVRFQRQARGILPEVIEKAIKRFDQIKTNPGSFNTLKNLINGDNFLKKEGDTDKDKARKEKIKNNPKELALYNWSDLDYLIVHNFEDPADRIASKEAAKIADGAETVRAKQLSETSGLNIYWGANAQECIELNAWFWKKNQDKIKENEEIIKPIVGARRWTDENVYWWCTGWRGADNRFEFYRFGTPPASVYYVEDTTLPVTDSHHIIVVHAQSDGRFRATDAFNDHSTEKIVSWDELIANWQPKLSSYNKVVVFKQFADVDEQSDKLYNNIGPTTFTALGTYNLKKGYITRKKRLLKKDFLQVVPDLQRLYIDVQCHPAITDRGRQERYQKMIRPFFDTTESDRARIKQASDQVRQNCNELPDEEYRNMDAETMYAPILDDPIIKQSSPAAYKLWKKFVLELLVDETKDVQGMRKTRGYATD